MEMYDFQNRVLGKIGKRSVPCCCRRVLVVDDEVLNVDVAKLLLKSLGYEGIGAFDGQESIDTFIQMYSDMDQ